MKDKRSVIIAAAIPVLSVLIVGGFLYINGKNGSGATDGTKLPVVEYCEQPKLFAGNEYSICAFVDSQLAYSESVGRIILIKTNSGKSLPLLVPAKLEGFNPSVGQRYNFSVRIDEGGKLLLTDFRKM